MNSPGIMERPRTSCGKSSVRSERESACHVVGRITIVGPVEQAKSIMLWLSQEELDLGLDEPLRKGGATRSLI